MAGAQNQEIKPWHARIGESPRDELLAAAATDHTFDLSGADLHRHTTLHTEMGRARALRGCCLPAGADAEWTNTSSKTCREVNPWRRSHPSSEQRAQQGKIRPPRLLSSTVHQRTLAFVFSSRLDDLLHGLELAQVLAVGGPLLEPHSQAALGNVGKVGEIPRPLPDPTLLQAGGRRL